MSDLLETCEKYFGSRDFYEVLKIEKAANASEIKRAYHRLSLLVHPDRVSENEKDVATEKFKVLGKIHSILSDSSKREIYDESGSFDEDHDSMFNWLDYWRSLFKRITTEDIVKYEQEYVGSETEKNDVKKAYLGGKGSMDYIIETVPFVNCDSEPRIIEMVKAMIKNDEVPEYSEFLDEPQSKKDKRRKKWEKEKAEVADISESELNNMIKQNQERREKRFCNYMTELEEKYSKKKKPTRKSIKPQGEPSTRRTRSMK